MGKLKTRVKGASKGKRWAKGQSSSSNPTFKKHREAAKGNFFQPFLLNAKPSAVPEKGALTEEALKQHTYASNAARAADPNAPTEVITAPPSISQGDFGDDETATVCSGLTFRTNSSFKTFATGFSNCSNLSFSKLYRGFTPKSALHREMLAVLAAISEVIKAEGGKETDTEYFAALMTTLEVTETSEDALGATLGLLGMVIKRVPANVLKLKFSTAAKTLLDLLGKHVESDNNFLLRSLIGCLGVLLRNQDTPVWSVSSTLQIYDALLTFVTSPKPQVRKAAQHAICTVLKGSTFLIQDEKAPRLHPVASRTAKYCLAYIEEHGYGSEPSSLLHLLNLLKEIMAVLPQSDVKSLAESLLKLMTLNNVLVTSCAMQCFHGLMVGRPDPTTTLSADLNARLITALYDYQPSMNDTQPLRGWLSVMTQSLLNLGRIEPKLCIGHLPRFFSVVTQLWSSDRMEIVHSVTPSLSSILTQSLDPDLDKTATEKLVKSVEQSLGYQTVKAWKQVIHLSTTLIEVVGKSQPELLTGLIKTLASLRASPNFPYETEADYTIGKAIRVCGPRFVLKCVPLGITGREPEPYEFSGSWLLPILRENISHTELTFFIEYFLPLADVCRERIQRCKNEQDRIGYRVFDLLQRQMWALLPAFCKNPTDVSVSFKRIAKLLGQVITDRPDVRMDVMAALRQLIIHSKNDEKIRAEISRYAKNYIPLLFNQYTTKATTDEEESQRASVYETVTYYLQVADPALLHSLFDKAKEKLQTATAGLTSEDKTVAADNQFVWESVLALLRALIVYQDTERIEGFVQLCLPWIMGSEAKPQKKAYRIVEDIVGADEDTECGRHVRQSMDRIVKLFTTSKDVVKPTSRASRLRSINRLAPLLRQTAAMRRFLSSSAQEAVAAVKGVGEKVRSAAFTLLITIGRTLQGWSQEPQVALKDYVALLMKGLNAGKEASVAASVTSVTYVVHEFASNCTEELIETVLERILTLLVTEHREVVLACLTFIRMFTVTVHSQRLPLYLKRLIDGLSGMDEELKRVYLIKTRDILIRLLRKCGADLVMRLVPENDTVLLKRLNNIRKIEARKKRQKEEQKNNNGDDDGEDEDDQVMATQPKTMEHVLADSDDESELDDEGPVKDARRRLPKTWIQDNETSIVDFLDPAAAQKVSATNPRLLPQQAAAEKRKKKESLFKFAPDGRMIIEDGSDSDSSSSDEDIDISEALDNLKVDRKRKWADSESIKSQEEPSFKYQAGGSGIHRPVGKAESVSGASIRKVTTKQRVKQSKENSKSTASDFGVEYRSAKARGDVKRKGKPDPFAYVPLARSALNKRKKAKLEGQFKGLVRAARKGASTGTKIRGKSNVKTK